jgi:hypothetical protein
LTAIRPNGVEWRGFCCTGDIGAKKIKIRDQRIRSTSKNFKKISDFIRKKRKKIPPKLLEEK